MAAIDPFEEGDPSAHNALEVHIDIYSEELSPDQLTDYLGVPPDKSHDLGAPELVQIWQRTLLTNSSAGATRFSP